MVGRASDIFDVRPPVSRSLDLSIVEFTATEMKSSRLESHLILSKYYCLHSPLPFQKAFGIGRTECPTLKADHINFRATTEN